MLQICWPPNFFTFIGHSSLEATVVMDLNITTVFLCLTFLSLVTYSSNIQVIKDHFICYDHRALNDAFNTLDWHICMTAVLHMLGRCRRPLTTCPLQFSLLPKFKTRHTYFAVVIWGISTSFKCITPDNIIGAMLRGRESGIIWHVT